MWEKIEIRLWPLGNKFELKYKCYLYEMYCRLKKLNYLLQNRGNGIRIFVIKKFSYHLNIIVTHLRILWCFFIYCILGDVRKIEIRIWPLKYKFELKYKYYLKEMYFKSKTLNFLLENRGNGIRIFVKKKLLPLLSSLIFSN